MVIDMNSESAVKFTDVRYESIIPQCYHMDTAKHPGLIVPDRYDLRFILEPSIPPDNQEHLLLLLSETYEHPNAANEELIKFQMRLNNNDQIISLHELSLWVRIDGITYHCRYKPLQTNPEKAQLTYINKAPYGDGSSVPLSNIQSAPRFVKWRATEEMYRSGRTPEGDMLSADYILKHCFVV